MVDVMSQQLTQSGRWNDNKDNDSGGNDDNGLLLYSFLIYSFGCLIKLTIE
jgi:hypothetical protein